MLFNTMIIIHTRIFKCTFTIKNTELQIMAESIANEKDRASDAGFPLPLCTWTFASGSLQTS